MRRRLWQIQSRQLHPFSPRTHSPMEGMGKNGGRLYSRPVLELSLE